MFQHASEDRRATGSYLWRIRQPGGKGVPSYLFATLEGPGPWKQKTDIMSLVPANVMEAFEVPLIKHITKGKCFVSAMSYVKMLIIILGREVTLHCRNVETGEPWVTWSLPSCFPSREVMLLDMI